MSLKNTHRNFHTSIENCNVIAPDFIAHFEAKGYTVTSESFGNDLFLSMTQGGIFKTISGMKTGLNINIKKISEGISVDMEVGIFGKQAAASVITYFVAWPMIIPQIIGLINQNKLDEEAYATIENILQTKSHSRIAGNNFCETCGTQLTPGAKFCPECGTRVDGNNCPKCGKELPSGTKFCPYCGERIN